ncbi:HD-GYP domain-containing protein [Oceanospirillum sp.]|uniref:HD-GYP domain-containing protein n=1 Tax=Oceanospirillum sp. TaxID=2021254 RepID=UPI003A8FA3AB
MRPSQLNTMTTEPLVKLPANHPTEDPSEWGKKNRPSEELSLVLNASIPAKEKASAVFEHCSDLMHNLMNEPVTEQLIEETSQPIIALAECVIADEDVSGSLLRITSHDYYTYTHCVNVGVKSLLIAKHMLKTADDNLMKELGVGFFLHDIGKSQVDPGILNKPGRLTDEEFAIMRNHPERGAELLRQANSLDEIREITVLQHHEKIDGTGYPYGLKGDEFHQFGQICALADIYDALTAERSYKKGMTVFEALKLMKDKMSHHFDEKLFNSFIQLFIKEST